MDHPQTLPKTTPTAVAVDQRQLNDIGLKRLRALAGTQWTDHNVHDPGITLLEMLAYGLTDLSARAALTMPALVSPGRFPTARTVLPNEPLTRLDYRKLVLDVPGVKNAWVEPAPLELFGNAATGEVTALRPAGVPHTRALTLRGLYKVVLDYDDSVITTQTRTEIKEKVAALLHAHRNLGEDFAPIEDVPTQTFIVCGEIELAADADVPFVHASVLEAVRRHLAPGVAHRSLAAMKDTLTGEGTRYTAPEIFEGPALASGFVVDSELERADLLREIRLSDVQGLVMAVPGVVAIRDMLVSPIKAKGALANRWVVAVDDGHSPVLDPLASRVVYYKRGMPIVAKAPAAPAASANASQRADRPEEWPIPTAEPLDVAAYTSVQHHLPAVYGVGEHGLAADVRPERRAQAQQLKAYLMFFDQIMANFCAQLAGFDRLLSTDDTRSTYFTQPVGATEVNGSIVETLPGYDQIYDGQTGGDPRARFTKILDALSDVLAVSESAASDRRQRALDHLIARYGERFHDYVAIMQSAFGATDSGMLADRRRFLDDYPTWGGRRGRGDDRTLQTPSALWDSNENISGLEHRLSRLLGIPNDRRRSLSKIPLDADATIAAVAGGFGFTLVNREVAPGQVPPVLFRQANPVATQAQARALLLRALDLAQTDAAFLRTAAAGQQGYSIVDSDGEVVAAGEPLADPAARDERVTMTRSYLRAHYSREGLFVIEDVLLRPIEAGDASLHYCADPGCDECASDDPYSHRIHVVLPAFVGRFRNMDFRRFAESVIREEMPAYLLPRICWADEEAMAGLETAYRDWLEVRAGVHPERRQARLNALVARLQEVRSTYPAQPLVRCKDPNKPKFLLGRASLGKKRP